MTKDKPKFHPILFSTPMVQAIMDGRKIQTRRTRGLEEINSSPSLFDYDGICDDENDSYYGCHFFEHLDKNGRFLEMYNPIENKHNIGDVFWVRETFFDCRKHKNNANTFLTINDFQYKADNDFIGCNNWKPSIFMKKEACRIFLKIKSIRVERLQSISQSDAIAEGIKQTWFADDFQECRFKNYINDGEGSLQPCQSFRSLWKSINGDESFNNNPFVWVYEFEQIEKPLDFIV
jgi:hypothetical protein